MRPAQQGSDAKVYERGLYRVYNLAVWLGHITKNTTMCHMVY